MDLLEVMENFHFIFDRVFHLYIYLKKLFISFFFPMRKFQLKINHRGEIVIPCFYFFAKTKERWTNFAAKLSVDYV